MWGGTTRALLNQHMLECSETRERTKTQFEHVSSELTSIRSSLSKVLRVISVGAGVGLTLAAAGSPIGQRIVAVVFQPSSQSAQTQNTNSQTSIPPQQH